MYNSMLQLAGAQLRRRSLVAWSQYRSISSTTTYKQLFEDQAQSYAKFRPTYIDKIYERVLGFAQLKRKALCLDVATGQGQAAVHLATLFDKVIAIDATENQIAHTTPRDNIDYKVADAHATGLADDTVDLVTVAQAMHWFDLPRFYKEVVRVLHPDGCFAAWAYDLCTFPESPAATKLLHDVCNVTLGPYWADRRKLVDNHYDGMAPGPDLFAEAEHVRHLPVRSKVTIAGVVGYASSWSAYNTYCREHPGEGAEVMRALQEGLLQALGAEDPRQEVEVETDFFMILARKPVK